MKPSTTESWLEEQPGVLEKYYDKVISQKGERYRKYSFTSNKTVVCPLHDDNDPSMGVIVSKGRERFHCFGCGAWGNVVDLAVRTRVVGGVGRETAAGKIAEVLGLDVPQDVLDGSLGDGEDLHPTQKRRKEIKRRMKSFGRDDFRRGVLEVRRGTKPLGYLDSLIVTSMVESLKEER